MRIVQHYEINIPVPDSIPVDDEIESEYLDGYLIGQDQEQTPDSIQEFKSDPNVIVYHPCFWQGVDDGLASRTKIALVQSPNKQEAQCVSAHQAW